MSELLQNALRGAFCTTFDLYLASIWHKALCFVSFEWPFYTGFLLQQGISEPLFYGDLVYKFKRIVWKPNFSDQFKQIFKRYIKDGYGLDVMRQSGCLVLNPNTVYRYGFLFNCTTVGQASDSMTALTYSFNRWVGAWCLSVAGPTVAQLEVFFSSDYLWVVSPFLCFIIVC